MLTCQLLCKIISQEVYIVSAGWLFVIVIINSAQGSGYFVHQMDIIFFTIKKSMQDFRSPKLDIFYMIFFTKGVYLWGFWGKGKK